jgi:hypothetical protein
MVLVVIGLKINLRMPKLDLITVYTVYWLPMTTTLIMMVVLIGFGTGKKSIILLLINSKTE